MKFGSLTNMLAGTPASVTPVVGMGATYHGWTDRTPYTVVAVSKTGKTVTVQEDDAVRSDNNGMSESQGYLFIPNANNPKLTLRLTKQGWSHKGMKFTLGSRSKYHDYSF